jgi:hypothetical protein
MFAEQHTFQSQHSPGLTVGQETFHDGQGEASSASIPAAGYD